jgi:SAM-dependent methyltransferase
MSGSGGLAGFKAFEAEGWSDRAPTYGDLLGTVTARLAEPLLDAAGVRHDMRVLDVATGPGYVAERAATRGAHAIGIDISDGMLELARSRQPQLDFRWADAEELPFDHGRFDAVVGGFVLNHLPNPERAVAEAARVLSPGGAVAYSVWDRPERNRINGLVADAIEDVGVERPPELADGPDSYRFSDDPAFESLLDGAGLDRVQVETVDLMLEAPGPGAFWDGFMGSSVRMRAVIDAQPNDVRQRIRDAFEQRVDAHRTPRGLEVPAVVKLGSARSGAPAPD